MGTIKQGILGGFAGKVGGVVGSSWKGIAVMKALPLSVANPKTAGQVAQRTAFSAVTKMGSILLATNVKPLWDRFAQQASGYNDFVSANVGFFSALGIPSLSDLIMSRGSLEGADIDSAEASDGATDLTVSWTDNSGTGNALSTDEVYIVALDNDNEIIKGFATGVTRVTASVVVNIDQNWAASLATRAYLSFRRPDGTIVSDSTNLAITIS